MASGGRLISVHPEELTFGFELEKPCSCSFKVVNNTEHHVVFKVKTTSPRKYFVRPNTSVVQPWDSCTITVTLQAQKEYPPELQCKDKFLVQSTKVPPITDIDDLPSDTFDKKGDKVIEECILKVVYSKPSKAVDGNSDNSDSSRLTSAGGSSKQASDNMDVLKTSNNEQTQMLRRLMSERDATVQQNEQFQRELEMLRRRRASRGSNAGFSLRSAVFAGVAGVFIGILLALSR